VCQGSFNERATRNKRVLAKVPRSSSKERKGRSKPQGRHEEKGRRTLPIAAAETSLARARAKDEARARRERQKTIARKPNSHAIFQSP
jgi:hypothetical protein